MGKPKVTKTSATPSKKGNRNNSSVNLRKRDLSGEVELNELASSRQGKQKAEGSTKTPVPTSNTPKTKGVVSQNTEDTRIVLKGVRKAKTKIASATPARAVGVDNLSAPMGDESQASIPEQAEGNPSQAEGLSVDDLAQYDAYLDDDVQISVNPNEDLFQGEREFEKISSTLATGNKILAGDNLTVTIKNFGNPKHINPVLAETITNNQEDQAQPSTSTGVAPQPYNLEEEMKKNPAIMNMFEDMVDRRVRQVTRDLGNGGNSWESHVTPAKQKGGPQPFPRLVKSPSDTTLHAPGLKMMSDTNGPGVQACNENVINHISQFVERVRIDTADSQRVESVGQPQLVYSQELDEAPPAAPPCDKRPRVDSGTLEAREVAQDLLVQADQYKAVVRKPEGIPNANVIVTQSLPVQEQGHQGLVQGHLFHNAVPNEVGVAHAMPGGVAIPLASNEHMHFEDDEFFHLTCHVDSTMKQKIERGEFIELEKLLPRTRTFNQKFSDDNKMQLVNRDGSSFWVPMEREKISSLRKWDQAFRIYAAIYSRANPSRSPKIWQYIHVITTAANTYSWDNVAEYDYTFRQLMATYPQRSWARIYHQMWNLALHEPASRSQYNYGSKGNNSGSGSGAMKTPEGRDRYCWKYNKNKCRNPKCEWEHRCHYCDGWGHGYWNCYKRLGKKKEQNGEGKTTASAAK